MYMNSKNIYYMSNMSQTLYWMMGRYNCQQVRHRCFCSWSLQSSRDTQQVDCQYPCSVVKAPAPLRRLVEGREQLTTFLELRGVFPGQREVSAKTLKKRSVASDKYRRFQVVVMNALCMPGMYIFSHCKVHTQRQDRILGTQSWNSIFIFRMEARMEIWHLGSCSEQLFRKSLWLGLKTH